MKSYTGVGQYVGHPHSPKHHYTVYAEPTCAHFFCVEIRLTTYIMVLHRCVFGRNPFQRTTARFALIM